MNIFLDHHLSYHSQSDISVISVAPGSVPNPDAETSGPKGCATNNGAHACARRGALHVIGVHWLCIQRGYTSW